MKRHLLPFLLSLLLAPVLVTSALAQTLDEVVEKHLAAMGGREALAKITTRKATGTITLSTAAGDFSGPAELFSKAPNKTRALLSLDVSAVGVSERMVIDQKFDGTSGWVLNSLQGDTQITGNQLDNMRNGVFPHQLLNYKAAGTTVVLQPKETLAGRSVFVLLVTPKIGSATRVFMDAETYMVVRTVSTINMPDQGGDMEQIGEASDYRTVDGIKVPFMTMNTTTNQKVTIKLDTVAHNVAIDDAMFSVK